MEMADNPMKVRERKCLIYTENGSLCSRPAVGIDPILGATVCEEHRLLAAPRWNGRGDPAWPLPVEELADAALDDVPWTA